jgi:hypothetical protein
MAFSPQAKYPDWATATCRRIVVPTFVDRGVSPSQGGGSPTAVNLSFLDRSGYFLFQVAPHLFSRGWVDPVPDPLLFRKSGSTGNRTWDLWVCSQEVWPLSSGLSLSLSLSLYIYIYIYMMGERWWSWEWWQTGWSQTKATLCFLRVHHCADIFPAAWLSCIQNRLLFT